MHNAPATFEARFQGAWNLSSPCSLVIENLSSDENTRMADLSPNVIPSALRRMSACGGFGLMEKKFWPTSVYMRPIPALPTQPMQDHLETLAQYCATLCVIECCGLDACDFSPIHIASYCLSREPRYPERVANEIIEQAKTLKANYGANGASACGIEISAINERLSGSRVDKLAQTLEQQTTSAIVVLGTEKADGRHPVFVWDEQRSP